MRTGLSEKIAAGFRAQAEAHGGWRLPSSALQLDLWGLEHGEARDFVGQRLCDFSIRCFEGPVEAPEGTARELDRAYIACVKDGYPARVAFEPFAEAALREGWLKAELPTGHDCHVEMPDAVADLPAAGSTRGERGGDENDAIPCRDRSVRWEEMLHRTAHRARQPRTARRMAGRASPRLLVACAWVVACSCSGAPTEPAGSDPVPEPLRILTTALPDLVQSREYSSLLLVAEGGDGSYVWSLASGAPPDGLILGVGGVLAGKPTTPGVSSFTVRVTSGGLSATQELTVAVLPLLQPADLCSEHPANAVVSFADLALARAVASELVGVILTCEVAATITSVSSGGAFIEEKVSDLTGIQNLSGLTELSLSFNVISDLEPLAGLEALTELALLGNQITNLDALRELTSLEVLLLSGNPIQDLDPLSTLNALTRLWLANTGLVDLDPLSGLTGLSDLVLSSNAISSVVPLAGLTQITTLDLVGNEIDDVAPLSGLSRLELLRLGQNAVSDVQPLSGLQDLTFLDLAANALDDVAPLGGLVRLRNLYLDANGLSNVAPLASLTALVVVHLGQNALTDIGALGGLSSLFSVDLEGNPDLSDVAPLLSNAGIGSGDMLNLEGTSVGCDDVAALRARGVIVIASRCA